MNRLLVALLGAVAVAASAQTDNHQPPRYGKEDPAAETGAESVQRKLESVRQQ